MTPTFGIRQTFILILLLALILSPRALAGVFDLVSATRFAAYGDYAGAATEFASAAERLPWSPRLMTLAGQAAWMVEDWQQALHWFSRAEAHETLSLADWLAYGDAFQALGDMQSAVWAWQQSIERFGSSTHAEWRLAGAFRQAGDFEHSIQSLHNALELAPEDADVNLELGLLLTATIPAEAMPFLMQAAALDQALDETVQTLRSELNRALLVDDPAYQFTVSGRALGALGEWDLAAEAFRRAVDSDAGYADAWAWLGEARQQTGQDGWPQLAAALALDTRSASVQALAGLYWMRQGEPGKALFSFEKAATLEPENAFWQTALGDAAAASGDIAKAALHYRLAVELAPGDPAGWRALALFSLENNTDVENSGLLAARQLLKLAPHDWLTYDIAGQVAITLNARVEAEAHLLKAIELAPQEPAPYFHLALAYLETGQTAQAYDKLLDTLSLDPDGPFGWSAQRYLEQYFP